MFKQREGKAKGDSSSKVKYKSPKHPCHNSRKDWESGLGLMVSIAELNSQLQKISRSSILWAGAYPRFLWLLSTFEVVHSSMLKTNIPPMPEDDAGVSILKVNTPLLLSLPYQRIKSFYHLFRELLGLLGKKRDLILKKLKDLTFIYRQESGKYVWGNDAGG